MPISAPALAARILEHLLTDGRPDVQPRFAALVLKRKHVHVDVATERALSSRAALLTMNTAATHTQDTAAQAVDGASKLLRRHLRAGGGN